jgi:hypothetical protein
MAWIRSTATLTVRVRDADNRATSFSLGLPGSAAFADLETFATTFAGLVATICNAGVEDIVLSLPAVPDEVPATGTAVNTAASGSEVERKAVFIFETEEVDKYSVIKIPTFDQTEADGGAPALSPVQTDGATINQNHAFIAAFLDAFLSPVTPVATEVYGCSSTKNYLFTAVSSAYKQHRESVAGDSGSQQTRLVG